jgi:hypothetical protein
VLTYIPVVLAQVTRNPTAEGSFGHKSTFLSKLQGKKHSISGPLNVFSIASRFRPQRGMKPLFNS